MKTSRSIQICLLNYFSFVLTGHWSETILEQIYQGTKTQSRIKQTQWQRPNQMNLNTNCLVSFHLTFTLIHSCNRYSVSVHSVPDSDLGLGDTARNKTCSEYFICANYQTMLFSFVEPPLSKSIFYSFLPWWLCPEYTLKMACQDSVVQRSILSIE